MKKEKQTRGTKPPPHNISLGIDLISECTAQTPTAGHTHKDSYFGYKEYTAGTDRPQQQPHVELRKGNDTGTRQLLGHISDFYQQLISNWGATERGAAAQDILLIKVFRQILQLGKN